MYVGEQLSNLSYKSKRCLRLDVFGLQLLVDTLRFTPRQTQGLPGLVIISIALHFSKITLLDR